MAVKEKEGETAATVAEVLERIRRRLQQQVRQTLDLDSPGPGAAGPPAYNAEVLRQLLAALLTAHSQVGVVNPRPPGLHNRLVQLVKRGLQRLLSWYTRPLTQSHALTARFLSEASDILTRQESQLRALEERINLLAAAQAELREQVLPKLEEAVREQGKSTRERA